MLYQSVKQQVFADNVIRKKFPNLASRARGAAMPPEMYSSTNKWSANQSVSVSDSKKYNPHCSSNSSNSDESINRHSMTFQSDVKSRKKRDLLELRVEDMRKSKNSHIRKQLFSRAFENSVFSQH